VSAPIQEEIKVQLLEIARDALRSAAEREDLPPLDLSNLPMELLHPGASFVTLSKDNALRGCIGGLKARLPLVEDVRQHTVAAALHDFRFPAIQADEVDDIQIEISILTEPEPLEYENPDELLDILRPKVDGVIITDGKKRATFLPQVWERVPSPSVFLSMLCEKANLPADAWREGNLQVFIYQVETIHESQTPKEQSS
jgi:AmmeMemoRadiSam system protein A